VLLSALFGWMWSVGWVYWRELSIAPADQAWHLLATTSAVFLARWGVTLRQVPASAGLEGGGFATVFTPLMQSALFYAALVVALLFVAAVLPIAFGIDVRMTDSSPRLSILAVAYAVRAATTLPPCARWIRGRLNRGDRTASAAADGPSRRLANGDGI